MHQSAKDRVARVASTVLLATLILAFSAYLYAHKAEIAKLQLLTLNTLLGFTLLRIGAFALFAFGNLILLQRLIPSLSFREIYLLSTTGHIAAQFFPAGGAIVAKGIYLRQRHALPLIDFAGTQVALMLLFVMVAAMFACAGAIGLWLLWGEPPPLLWLFVLLPMSTTLLPLIFGARLLNHLPKSWERIRGLAHIWPRVHNQRTVWKLAGVFGLRGLLSFVTMGWIFHVLAPAGFAFWIGGILDAMTSVLHVIRITPGNLGLYESSVGVLGHAESVSVATGIVAAAIYRIVGLLGNVTVAALFLMNPRRLSEFKLMRTSDADD